MKNTAHYGVHRLCLIAFYYLTILPYFLIYVNLKVIKIIINIDRRNITFVVLKV